MSTWIILLIKQQLTTTVTFGCGCCEYWTGGGAFKPLGSLSEEMRHIGLSFLWYVISERVALKNVRKSWSLRCCISLLSSFLYFVNFLKKDSFPLYLCILISCWANRILYDTLRVFFGIVYYKVCTYNNNQKESERLCQRMFPRDNG